MMDVRPIRTEEDYEAALLELDRLIDAKQGTPDYDRLEVLSILVESYETDHHPVPLPDPIAAIEFHMDRLGLSRSDLEPYIGSRGRVSEILNRKRPLTLRMIRNLEAGLGIPAAILVQDYPLQDDEVSPSAERQTLTMYPARSTELVLAAAHDAPNADYEVQDQLLPRDRG
jgi:HTH-type transcriptional regulator/antitoxin HigA